LARTAVAAVAAVAAKRAVGGDHRRGEGKDAALHVGPAPSACPTAAAAGPWAAIIQAPIVASAVASRATNRLVAEDTRTGEIDTRVDVEEEEEASALAAPPRAARAPPAPAIPATAPVRPPTALGEVPGEHRAGDGCARGIRDGALDEEAPTLAASSVAAIAALVMFQQQLGIGWGAVAALATVAANGPVVGNVGR